MELGLDTMQSSTNWAAGGLDQLSPVGRETVQDRIYRQLRGGLICGGFDAGEVFLAGDVAARLSVSSMPVREALARLVSERALEAMANRRVRVPLLTLERGRDIAAARRLIECDLAKRAMHRFTASELTELEEINARYEATGAVRDVMQMNHAFHFAIYAKAGSAVMLPIVESLWMQSGPYLRAAARLHQPLIDLSATEFHGNILQAMRQGDEARIARELEADIQRAIAILERAPASFWDVEGEAA